MDDAGLEAPFRCTAKRRLCSTIVRRVTHCRQQRHTVLSLLDLDDNLLLKIMLLDPENLDRRGPKKGNGSWLRVCKHILRVIHSNYFEARVHPALRYYLRVLPSDNSEPWLSSWLGEMEPSEINLTLVYISRLWSPLQYDASIVGRELVWRNLTLDVPPWKLREQYPARVVQYMQKDRGKYVEKGHKLFLHGSTRPSPLYDLADADTRGETVWIHRGLEIRPLGDYQKKWAAMFNDGQELVEVVDLDNEHPTSPNLL